MTLTGSCHCGRTAFRIDGEVPERLTRRIGIDVRLFDPCDVALAKVVVIDGKHLG